MSTSTSGDGARPDGPGGQADSDADPGEMHPRDERGGSVDGVAEDETDPGHDPDGDPDEVSRER